MSVCMRVLVCVFLCARACMHHNNSKELELELEGGREGRKMERWRKDPVVHPRSMSERRKKKMNRLIMTCKGILSSPSCRADRSSPAEAGSHQPVGNLKGPLLRLHGGFAREQQRNGQQTAARLKPLLTSKQLKTRLG